jgi:lipopolysaccharide/colanic/teichoic acid biosynthesis glycosyltransferase/ActR/RegA family two-component response regulator
MKTLPTLLVVDDEPMTRKMLKHIFGNTYNVVAHENAQDALDWLQKNPLVSCVLADLNMPKVSGKELLRLIRKNPLLSHLPFIVISGAAESAVRIECLTLGADDFITKPFNPEEVKLKVEAVMRRVYDSTFFLKKLVHSDPPFLQPNISIPSWKRAFDIVAAGTVLLLISPLLALVALLIKIDSKGPVFYASKRVGKGYKIFDLHKFRTMRTDADQMIKAMDKLNMYNGNEATERPTTELQGESMAPQTMLYKDNQWMTESEYLLRKSNKAPFMKFQNDPRITRLGKFLRNTSLDELPQLWNILVGDMSLVGNRPLPLYEAEQLTTDQAIARFDGPAGLTGLWQVTKRGKGQKDMSAAERIQLDIKYAQDFSPKMDLKIILKTFPALLQSESV